MKNYNKYIFVAISLALLVFLLNSKVYEGFEGEGSESCIAQTINDIDIGGGNCKYLTTQDRVQVKSYEVPFTSGTLYSSDGTSTSIKPPVYSPKRELISGNPTYGKDGYFTVGKDSKYYDGYRTSTSDVSPIPIQGNMYSPPLSFTSKEYKACPALGEGCYNGPFYKVYDPDESTAAPSDAGTTPSNVPSYTSTYNNEMDDNVLSTPDYDGTIGSYSSGNVQPSSESNNNINNVDSDSVNNAGTLDGDDTIYGVPLSSSKHIDCASCLNNTSLVKSLGQTDAPVHIYTGNHYYNGNPIRNTGGEVAPYGYQEPPLLSNANERISGQGIESTCTPSVTGFFSNCGPNAANSSCYSYTSYNK